MKKFTACLNVYDYETDLQSVVVEIEDDHPPYVAVLRAMQRICRITMAEACDLADTGSWQCILFHVVAGEMVRVAADTYEWPYQCKVPINRELQTVKNAIANAQAFETLREIPGMEDCHLAIDLRPAYDHVKMLEQQLCDIDALWASFAQPAGDGKESRAITLEDKACKTPTTTTTRPSG